MAEAAADAGRVGRPTTMTPQQALHAYVAAFVDELVRAGVHNVCVAPGSRSTPVAMLLAEHPAIHVWMHLDERSAAYFALGMAKASREPVGVLCTSGTAAANLFPAVVEARHSRVPLLVLTADRPPELRDSGAPQTIDQLRIYGNYPKWFAEAALPEATPDLLRYARTLAGKAVAICRAEPTGPVHINLPFREPLVPEPASPVDAVADDPTPWLGRSGDRPYVAHASGSRVADAETVAALAATLQTAQRGIVVCGPQTDAHLAEAVVGLAERLRWPVLADPLSLVRCGDHDLAPVIDGYDAFLRDERLGERLAPDLVLRLGALPTSKPLLRYLERHPRATHIFVDQGETWSDPSWLAAEVVQADPVATCLALTDALNGCAADCDWLDTWRAVNERAVAAVADRLAATDEPFEGRAFAELAAVLPDEATLFAGSSMPVRDLDTFFPRTPRRLRFLANRGANGIDGVVSTALGAVAVSPGPVVLVIGDLSFYHDLNGLLAARLHQIDATIVLLNNDGGGIFSFLPQAAHPSHFEQLFGTPHGLDFRHAAALYGAEYERVERWDAFRSAVARGIATPGLSIIELRTVDRERNVALHGAVWQAVSAALDGWH